MSDSLTDKQKAFCREYLKDFNAKQASIRAGYSEDSAGSIGHENLNKPEVQRHIQELAGKMNSRTDNKIERIITELQLIAFGSLRDVLEWDAGGVSLKNSKDIGDSARLVSEVSENRTDKATTTKVKMHDKLKALELLGRYHKIFSDKIEQDSKQKIEIVLAHKRGE